MKKLNLTKCNIVETGVSSMSRLKKERKGEKQNERGTANT